MSLGWLTIALFFVIAFIAAWIPFSTVVVPEWKVQIVDTSNSPCVKQTAHQFWSHYSLFDDTNSEYRKSNSEGYVVFPERTIARNLIQRVVYPVASYTLLIVTAHADVGISAYVGASEPVNAGVWGLKYDRTEPLPEKLIIKRCFVDHDIPDTAGNE